jgi:DNA-binding response OmpR family regulator
VTASPQGAAGIPVVDDDPDLRRVLTLALADEGYDVRAAPDGRAALAVLETLRPRAIMPDLMMPVLDGWGFRARQLAASGAEDVPVIVLSAARDARVEALRPAGVVPKPFNLQHLLDTVADVAR